MVWFLNILWFLKIENRIFSGFRSIHWFFSNFTASPIIVYLCDGSRYIRMWTWMDNGIYGIVGIIIMYFIFMYNRGNFIYKYDHYNIGISFSSWHLQASLMRQYILWIRIIAPNIYLYFRVELSIAAEEQPAASARSNQIGLETLLFGTRYGSAEILYCFISHTQKAFGAACSSTFTIHKNSFKKSCLFFVFFCFVCNSSGIKNIFRKFSFSEKQQDFFF